MEKRWKLFYRSADLNSYKYNKVKVKVKNGYMSKSNDLLCVYEHYKISLILMNRNRCLMLMNSLCSNVFSFNWRWSNWQKQGTLKL